MPKQITPKTAQQGRELALGLVARREYGVEELRRKLVDKGVQGRDAREIVQELTTRKFVDDARYALARARYRAVFSRWGAQRIRQELKQAGVALELIDTALKRLASEEGVVFAEEAERAVARRFRKALPDVPDRETLADNALGAKEQWEARQTAQSARQKERQKRVAYLVRRGYSFAEASAAVEAALEAQAAEG